MDLKNRIVPYMAVPPGFGIQTKLEEDSISLKAFASYLGMSVAMLRQLFVGKRKITPPIAQKLAASLGLTADIWLRLQEVYEYDCKVIKQRNAAKRLRKSTRRNVKTSAVKVD